jgi:DNA-binding PadR family transcriptional regulator
MSQAFDEQWFEAVAEDALRASEDALRAMGAHGHGHGRRRHGPPPFPPRGPFPFPPFFFGGRGFRGGPRARRGDVRAAVLLLLAEETRNGYQLMQEIEQRSGGVWRPSPGSVYPALAQLEDEGLVRVEERDGRRTYVLTDAGWASVNERRDDLVAPWEEMSESVDDDVASLFDELRQVGMAAAQIAQVGSLRQNEQARAALASVRRTLYSLLAADDDDEEE